MRRKRRTGLVLILSVLLAGASIVAVTMHSHYAGRAQRVFKRFVMDPIPPSVTELKVVGWNLWNYRYVLRFDISRSDIASILAAKPFETVEEASYEDGLLELCWSPGRGLMMEIFMEGCRRPSWFALESWDAFDAYTRHETKIDAHRQILLYNAQLGQAYFIVVSDN